MSHPQTKHNESHVNKRRKVAASERGDGEKTVNEGTGRSVRSFCVSLQSCIEINSYYICENKKREREMNATNQEQTEELILGSSIVCLTAQQKIIYFLRVEKGQT